MFCSLFGLREMGVMALPTHIPFLVGGQVYLRNSLFTRGLIRMATATKSTVRRYAWQHRAWVIFVFICRLMTARTLYISMM